MDPGLPSLLILNFDGGSRGNPGSAGVGVVLSTQDGTPLLTVGKYIGRATNNVSEYMALIIGLREAARLGAKKLLIRGDSELIIKQMRGEYRVKNPALRDLYDQAQTLLRQFPGSTFEHNLRHQNSLADRLANLAMDHKRDVTEVDDPSGGTPDAQPPVRLLCPNCGCRIQVITPSPQADDPKQFVCPCGSQMV